MAKLRKVQSIVMAVLVAGAVAGCSATGGPAGTAKQVTSADAPSLTGTWNGLVSPSSGSNYPATLMVSPDGSYTTSGGPFMTEGKMQIVNGHIHFVSTGGTGAMGVADRSGTAVVMDRGSSWGLVGNGYSSVTGPYNFDFNKTK
jgi:hypothetical protein